MMLEGRDWFGLLRSSRRRRVFVAIILVVAGLAALSSLRQDSQTYDELAHLTAGASYWITGDYRLQPEHPPLAKLWAALPLLVMDHHWPGPRTPGWLEGEVWQVGRAWLYQHNDVERLLLPARLMMLPIYLATCLAAYALSMRILGPAAGLLTLILAALCPTMATNGRLVTNDTTLSLCATLTLLAYARLAQRFSWGRLAVACLMLALTALAKSSWMLILPALLVMAGLSLVAENVPESGPAKASDVSGARRLRPILLTIAASLIAVWIGIWAAYGFRYSPFRGDDSAFAVMTRIDDPGRPSATNMGEAWETILHDSSGTPRRGLMAGFIRASRSLGLFPEAMLYGLAHNLKFSESPPGYLMGEIYRDGRVAYFPVALGIKTPIGILLLFALGATAIVLGKVVVRDSVALAGIIAYGVIVLAVAMASNFNIGVRHVLPVYPILFVIAGAAAAWMAPGRGKWLLGLLLLWVAVARVWIHPHYLSYFNEIVGGPSQGHKYLADSNIDWGQDLKRLQQYASAHPGETIKLGYFGSADPVRYGFTQMLPSAMPFGESAPLTGGTYVVSVHILLAVLAPTATDAYWADPKVQQEYASLNRFLSTPVAPDAPESVQQQRRAAHLRFTALRYSRLIYQLRHRAADDRIGYSLFVYRLSQAQVDEMLQP